MNAAPDIVGEIVGYRAWQVVTSTLSPPVLVSLFHRTAWHPGRWIAAECRYGSEGIPHEGHNCGIYAARDRSHLAFMGYNDAPITRPLAIGEVGLAGDVIPGELGWRAEKARPLRLWVRHVDWELVRPLREAYGIPVLLTNTLRGW